MTAPIARLGHSYNYPLCRSDAERGTIGVGGT
jgi:hypothetical protein